MAQNQLNDCHDGKTMYIWNISDRKVHAIGLNGGDIVYDGTICATIRYKPIEVRRYFIEAAEDGLMILRHNETKDGITAVFSTKEVVSESILCAKCNRVVRNQRTKGYAPKIRLVEDSLESDKVESGPIHTGIGLISAAKLITAEQFVNEWCDNEEDKAKAKIVKAGFENESNDLMFLTFSLAHVGINGNRHEFLDEQLTAAVDTPIYKLLNWQHGEPNIGCMIVSKIKEATPIEDKHIEVVGAVSVRKYPMYAQEIVERDKAGTLFTSMETWYEKLKCNICGAEFEFPHEYCQHAKAITSAVNPYPDAAIQLYGITFAGAGIVDVPADSQSRVNIDS